MTQIIVMLSDQDIKTLQEEAQDKIDEMSTGGYHVAMLSTAASGGAGNDAFDSVTMIFEPNTEKAAKP